jgi:uncharacterized membrane protein YjjB (DUF3815 family)
VFGRVWRVPAVVFAVPGLIPFVPGSLAFRAVSDLLILTTGTVSADDTLLMKVVVSTLKSVLIVGAIAAGVAVPSLLLRRDRPMT